MLFRPAREEGHRHQHAEEPAVEGHSPLPHVKDFDRVGKIIIGSIKEYIAQASAKHDAKNDVKQYVVHFTLA
jgi:hypothetical protein